MKCCICEGKIEVKRTATGKIYWRDGENAEPVKEGRCCMPCNETVVIPYRLRLRLRTQ